MQVFRGPSSTYFSDDSHQVVAKVEPSELEKRVKEQRPVQFNITKDGAERHAVCTLQFEDADIIAMHSGLLARLQALTACLCEVEELAGQYEMDAEVRVDEIQKVIRRNR